MPDTLLLETGTDRFLLEDGSGFLLMEGPSYYNAIIGDAPSSYWRLGESSGSVAHNETGGKDLTYFSATLGVAGALVGDPNTAATFTAASAGGTPTLPTTAITLECWYKGTSFGSYAGLIGNWNTNGCNLILNGGAGIEFRINANVIGATPANYNDGNWHHVVATWSASSVYNLYFDGVLVVGPFSVAGPIVYVDDFEVGQTAGGSHASLNGSVDEVAVYDYALTPLQVKIHYNAGISWQARRYGIVVPQAMNRAATR